MKNLEFTSVNGMRKVLLCAVAIVATFCLNAQIQMNSSGRVGVGTTPDGSYVLRTTTLLTNGLNYFGSSLGIGTPPTTTYRLEVNGRTHFTFSNTAPGFTFTTNTGVAPGVYISGDANYDLYVNGNAFTTGSWLSSDSRLKMNINRLDGNSMLAKLMRIDGKNYEFKSKGELEPLFRQANARGGFDFNIEAPDLSPGKQYGFIAQELETEFPELVRTDSITGMKAVNYNGMIPVLLSAIKEQQIMINELQNKIDEMTGSMQVDQLGSLSKNALAQNTPNPFSETTRIQYSLSENVSNAVLYIYNMNGQQLRSFPVRYGDEGYITIQGGDLKAGMYMYTLIVDGEVVNTRKMILTD